MGSVDTNKRSLVEADTVSLENRSLKFLMNEAVDRAAYEMAMKAIEPLSELDDVIDSGTKMPNTQAAIRKCIRDVNNAITSSPDPILSALRLSDAQRDLINAITACEVLKFSMLNAMDAVRMNFITDFRKDLKFYTDEVISYTVVSAPGNRLRLVSPQRVPFSKVKETSSSNVLFKTPASMSPSFMIVGQESASAGGRVVLVVPGSSVGIPVYNVSPGKIYITGRDVDDEPAPVDGTLKSLFLNLTPPPRAVLDETIEDLSTRSGRSFDLNAVVASNFRVPGPAEGMLMSIYRSIRGTSSVKPPSIKADDFKNDLKDITLSDFKKYFETLVSKTEGATGDITTYDTADMLFLGGLGAVSGALGITRSPSPAGGGSGAPAGGAGGAGGRGGGGGTGGGGGGGGGPGPSVARHSLRNILTNPMHVAGATAAEKSANLSKLSSAINSDELRSTLNRLTGGSVIFTEGTVDRWCELAGIKETKDGNPE